MTIKQVIVIRKDLKMRVGKAISQGAHASMASILPGYGRNVFLRVILFAWLVCTNSNLRAWLSGAFTKICVYVNSEEELLVVYDQAKEAGLLCSLIRDNGQTEFGGVKTHTAVSIGPAEAEKIDPITGRLALL